MNLKALSTDVAFYGVLDLTQRSVSLFMVPLYTWVLSKQEFGDLDMLMVMLSILTVLIDVQFVSGFSRLYLEYERRGEGSIFAGTVVIVRAVSGLALAGLGLLAGMLGYLELSFAPLFSRNVGSWCLVLMMVPLSLLYDVLLLQARMLRRKRAFALGALGAVVVGATLNVILVASFNLGIPGVLGGLLAAKVVGTGLLAWELRRELTLRVEFDLLKPLLAYTLPLVPGWWLSFASAYVGRFFVYGTHGAEANALLALSMKVTSVIALFSISFRSAWLPLAMGAIGEAGSTQFYVRSMRVFMAGSFGSTVCLAGALGPILLILAPGYAAVDLLFPLFAVGTLIGECESNFQLGNQIAKRTHWISIAAAVYLVVNVLVLLAFTASHAVGAAAAALCLASLGRVVVTYLSGQASWRIPYDERAIGLFAAGCVAFLLIGVAHANLGAPGWVSRSLMFLLGLGVPWLILAPTERLAIVRLFNSRGSQSQV